jgi:hypothetical protein
MKYMLLLSFWAGACGAGGQELSISELADQKERWPEEVTLKVAVEMKLMADGKPIGTLALPVGKTVRPVEISGEVLKIESMNLRGEVKISDTDFLEKIKPAQPEAPVKASEDGSAAAPSTATAAGPGDIQKLNEIFGCSLLEDENLWDDKADGVAKRIKWPEESRTATQASYRLYAKKEVRVLGVRPYSLVLYAQNGVPDRFSMVFANKGDFEGAGSGNEESGDRMTSREEREREKQARNLVKNFGDAVKLDADTIEGKLTSVLGEPQRQNFGSSGSMRETVSRWDWKGHAFLLASPKGEYTALRILPSGLADDRGQVGKIADADLREMLAGRILRRGNGDVVVQQIPMVDQGPKGFCVPATWERYLRYLEMPADMYVLAMAGGTKMGGGTYTAEIRENVSSYVRRYGRNIENVDSELTAKNLRKHLDKGLPLMWTCYVVPNVESAFTQRTMKRGSVADWKDYNESLKEIRVNMKGKRLEGGAHVRMIIGYNEETGEMAISDSWGRGSEERWMTLEEASAVSLRELTVIRW